MANESIKLEIRKSGLYHWQIAEGLNASPSTLSVRLRRELPENEKQEIRSIIERLSGQLVAK